MRSPKKCLRAAVRVLTTNVRLGVGKILHGDRLRFDPITCLALSDNIELAPDAKIDLGKSLRTRGFCSFNVQENGELILGKDIFLNRGCQFNCHSRITIGDACEFGPNVLVYDHDHIMQDGTIVDGAFAYGDVQIGSNCWIGAGTIILRGTRIGDGCVIAAGSVIKGEFAPRSLVLQKKATQVRRIR